jgi:type VII secretion integral membrane protein EccD
MTGSTLVRVTVAAPARRMDLALPERSPVAELLPNLLRQAGENLADDAVTTGGWVLHRADGTPVDATRPLGGQGIRDGEVLHLVPRRVQWPELEYDDLVDAIAGGASRIGRRWGPAHTRLAGPVVVAVTVGLVLAALLRAGPPWPVRGSAALTVAVLLLLVGTVLARAAGDAQTGSAVAALALPTAFAGGALLLGGSLPLSAFGAAQLLGGCAPLLLAAVIGHVGTVDRAAVFVGGATVALLVGPVAWAVTADALDGRGGAAVLAGAVLLFSPQFGPLSVRLGRVPMPVLPLSAADLVRDDPQPPRQAVYAAVLRADGFLTGMLAGAAGAAAAAEVVLARSDDRMTVVLLVLLCLGFGIRARLYPVLRQRLPMLLTCLVGGTALAAGLPGSLAVPVLLLVAVCALTAARVYSGRSPGAVIGRYTELVEIALVLTYVPLICLVLGLFGLARGWGG